MAKSIPEVKIGNEVYQIKDRTAREHLVEVSETQPESEDNKLWIKNQEAEYEIPTMDEFDDLKSAIKGVPYTLDYLNFQDGGIDVVKVNETQSDFIPNGTTYVSCVVPCDASTLFLVNIEGGGLAAGGGKVAYSFLDENYKVLKNAPLNSNYSEQYIYPVEGMAYAIFNCKKSKENYYIHKGELVTNILEQEIECSGVYVDSIARFGFTVGSIDSYGKKTTSSIRLVNSGFIRMLPDVRYRINLVPNTLQFVVHYFSTSDFSTEKISTSGWLNSGTEATSPSGTQYVKILVRKPNDANISTSDMQSISIVPITLNEQIHVNEKEAITKTGLYRNIVSNIEQGGFTGQGLNLDSTSRIRSKNYFPIGEREFIAVHVDTEESVTVGISFYSVDDYSTARIGSSGTISPGTVVETPEGTKYFRVLIRKTNDTSIEPSDITSCIVDTSGNYIKTNFVVTGQKTQNYIVGSDLLVRNVNVKKLGNLVNKQAFCYYDGKYYCPNNNNQTLTVLDESFATVETISIDLGHANGMQLGNVHPNYAYVSGWDDQKVYVLNLDTVTIVETITLPTTGYTTCAVDDVNGIMYIFQRESRPNTEEYYNLIVYDYVNQTEIRRSKTYLCFGAMQGAEFVDGKIIVLYGSPGSSIPTGAFMCNTNGDILLTYHIKPFDDGEPEGVCWDKTNKCLLVSSYISGTTQLFRIT